MESIEEVIEQLELIKAQLWRKDLSKSERIEVVVNVCDILLNRWILDIEEGKSCLEETE